jgi:hypothetical protein
VSGPFEMLGDPDAAACEGDVCALPPEQPQGERDDEQEPAAERS